MIELVQFEDDHVWYTLQVRGNREADASVRAAVKIRPMSQRELRRVEREYIDDKGDGIKVADVRDAMIARCVLAMRGLCATIIKGGVRTNAPIESTESLLKYATDEILFEIYGAIKDHSILADGVLGE